MEGLILALMAGFAIFVFVCNSDDCSDQTSDKESSISNEPTVKRKPAIGVTPKERNAYRLERLQTVFSELSLGTDCAVVEDKFGECEAISASKLVSEVLLENGVNRKVLIWYLDWSYVVSKSSSIGVMPVSGSNISPRGADVSFSYGTATAVTSNQTTQNAFIQMVFDNDKLVAKEQHGLYEYIG